MRVLMMCAVLVVAMWARAHSPSPASRALQAAVQPYGPMDRGAIGNPYSRAYAYVNPAFRRMVLGAAEQTSEPSLGPAMRVVAQKPTAVWLERSQSVAATLVGHLEGALTQWKRVKSRRAMTVTVVLYNMPGRDCAARASRGELRRGQLDRYRSEFIDPIRKVLAQPAYRKLRVVVVLEPDSLPNLVTNMRSASCAGSAPEYESAIVYAIQQLSTVPGVYLYMDAGNSTWLGWEHTERAARLYRKVINKAGGPDRIRGFATNVSSYTPTFETFAPYEDIPRHRKVIEDFYQWNRLKDEMSFVDAFREALGPDYQDKGFIVDTARNGWKSGSGRPSDARAHRGNWCNVEMAGLGNRPQVTSIPGVDAWMWLKPPGESDGRGTHAAPTRHPRLDPGGPDPACIPGKMLRNSVWPVSTNATPGAPQAGQWFQAHFEALVRNAQPPVRR
ncbi:MAG: cellulose 1,4-beta-cellobiosidase [Myxococcota bacterium]|jgi:cellulose 1,4-beta-cellobiosidase